MEPYRNSSDEFQQYQLGIGGPCQNFVPDAGYWCGNETSGGGAFTYHVPSGMIANSSVLPNSPYAHPEGAVIQVWRPAHWASWMFEIGEFNAATSTYTFSKGGFQGARGADTGEGTTCASQCHCVVNGFRHHTTLYCSLCTGRFLHRECD